MTRLESMTFKVCYEKLKTFLDAVGDSVLKEFPELGEKKAEASEAIRLLKDNINGLGKEFNSIVQEVKETQQRHFRKCPIKTPSVP